MSVRVVVATARIQLRMAARNIEFLMPVLVMPLQSVVSLAILAHADRLDLASYALCASLLMTVGQMSLFNASEVVANDRYQQLLELLVATPASYVHILATRTVILSSFGLVGFAVAWAMARFVFGVTVAVHHPWLFAATLLATVGAAGGTAILTAALFSLVRTTRTLQNAVNGPFYVLGGVLVPITYLPAWLQPLGPLVFLYWSANLVRASLNPAPPAGAAFQFSALCALGLAMALIGAWTTHRLLNVLRAEGRLGLT